MSRCRIAGVVTRTRYADVGTEPIATAEGEHLCQRMVAVVHLLPARPTGARVRSRVRQGVRSRFGLKGYGGCGWGGGPRGEAPPDAARLRVECVHLATVNDELRISC